MALTPEQRKTLLGFGGLSRIAKQLSVKLSAVSQTNGENKDGTSHRIRAAITVEIIARHPQNDGHVCDDCRGLSTDPSNVWPENVPSATSRPAIA